MSKFKADLILSHVQNIAAFKDAECEYPAYQVAYGYIYGDTERKRFVDGSSVRTSEILKIYGEDGEIFFETRNTIYRILKGVGYKAD